MKSFPVLCLAALGGCAVVERNEMSQQAIWLEEAGFRVVRSGPPSSSASGRTGMEKRVIGIRGGKTIYQFTDPDAGRVYLGGPREMAAYAAISTRDKARRAANLSRITPPGSRCGGPPAW